MQSPQNLIWIDLEMTGLEPEHDVIIEMATIVTDSDLNILATGPVIAVHQSDALLAGMDEWNTRTHGESGLTQRVRDSKISTAEAEAQTIAFLDQHVSAKDRPILAGSSIHQDRRFIVRYMPKLDRRLHYRMVDVSSIKELARRWYPAALATLPPKRESHRALDDIRESIDELRFYRRTIFLPPPPPAAPAAPTEPAPAAPVSGASI